MKAIPDVAAEFDRIASVLAEAHADSSLSAAEQAVLRAVPSGARSCLEVGCGDGRLARALAARGVSVLAIDVAPQMIVLARARTGRGLPVDYRVADVMDAAVAIAAVDVVLCVNVVHHLPLPVVVPRLAGFVAPGGTLIIQDVITRTGLRYLPRNIVAGLSARLRRLLHSSAANRRLQHLYDAHGRGEVYLQPDEVAGVLTPFLPGVAVIHHLGWRYTAIWHRRAAT